MSSISSLAAQAYLQLIRFDLCLMRGRFALLHWRVRNCQVAPTTPSQGTIEMICSSVDMACIWYWKEVLCLQRSAVTTCLLRRRGVAAVMIIGAQQSPFKAHAWVEVNGTVVNDKSYMREMYSVLERC